MANKAKLELIASMFIFGTIGIFVRHIPLPSSMIALVRAAMGALFRTNIYVCDSVADAFVPLKSDGHRVIAAALGEHALTLGEDPLREDDCVVIGNEGHGVSAETLTLADAVMRIPMGETTESLNAATAASVIMWEYFRTFRG